MTQVCAHQDSIRARGAGLLFVGNGTPAMARDFQARHCPQAEVAVDPERASYRAFELKRGVGATFAPRSVAGALQAWKEGHRQGAMQGDAWQQGGAFVIAPGGELRFAFVSQRSGDHPPVDELLAALPTSPGSPVRP